MMKRTASLLATASLLVATASAEEWVCIEAERFGQVAAERRSFGGVVGVVLGKADSSIRTSVTLPERVEAEIWARVYFPWAGQDAIELTLGRRRFRLGARTAAGGGRWDVGNFQVWHWVRAGPAALPAGKHDSRGIQQGPENVRQGSLPAPGADGIRCATAAWLVCVCLPALPARGEGPTVDAATFIDRRLADCGIQRAIDSLGAGGGTVVLPEGRYVLYRYLYLRSGVTLRGRGAKTVLAVGAGEQRRAVAGPVEGGSKRITVKGDLRRLAPGTIVHIWRHGARTHNVHRRALTVAAVEGQTLVFEKPYPFTLRPANNAHVSWGKTTRLKADAPKGGRSICVEHPGLFRPGYALKLTGKGDIWDHHFNVVTAIDGDTLRLERPLAVEPKAGGLVFQAHCMLTADGERKIGAEGLVIEGWRDPRPAPWRGFQLAGIHTVRCSDITLRNVEVRDWNGDGVSIQAGKNAVVAGCAAIRCKGRGFHPGTGFDNAEFTGLRAIGNTGDGFYYCWHNTNVNLRRSLLEDNHGHGVGGLGNPGDRGNVIEGNTIVGNHRAGIAVNGGKVSKNVIRGNTIRDNSRAGAGKYPGILLAAQVEDARAYTIEHNTIESTLPDPTQWVGIHEQHGRYRGKPTVADGNVIRNNTFRGHKTADVIVAGPNTVVQNPGAKIVLTQPPARP